MNTTNAKHLARMLRTISVTTVTCAAILVTTASIKAETIGPSATPEAVQAIRPPAAGSPAALVAQHQCWTGEPPADMRGVIPGHVVTQHGYQGSKAVGAALAQLFDGQDNGLTVYGFCR